MPADFAWIAGLVRRWAMGLLLLLAAPAALAQQPPKAVWQDATPGTAAVRVRSAAPDITPARLVRFQVAVLRQWLRAAPTTTAKPGRAAGVLLTLPMPDGSTERFQVTETQLLHPQLAARYPRIKTYAAQSLDHPTTTARLDLTPAGFHAQISTGESTVYIDPAAPGDTVHHRVIYRAAMRSKGIPCLTNEVKSRPLAPAAQLRANGSQLRTYRLAVACTGEYAQARGGTKEAALASIITTINRVSGIYERELAIQLQLVPATDALIFLDPDTDPYTNTNASALLVENQRTTDELIGSSAYDVGHVFGTRVGGLAYIGVVCDDLFKAGGTTGQSDPTGDAFDVDFVAHEMGHQFGADHTFNGTTTFCAGSRAAAWAYEPGSGSSIMGYAGLCSPQNIQPSSFPYFHSRSLDQILDFVAASGACVSPTPSGNRPPTAAAGGNFRIPAHTPFTLTGSGTDPDGDALTYAWEQVDLGPAGAPESPVGNAPIFQFLPPSPSPSRTFPSVASLLAATPPPPGEQLPTYSRRLRFRLVARDQRQPAGGVAYDTTSVAVVGTAGPFLVTTPAAGTTWLAGASHQVTWVVAGTSQAPINATQVDILLSTDGGLTFSTTLAAATPNDGCQLVTVPTGLSTAMARVKVQATGNVFFAISPQNFAIQAAPASTFYLVPECALGGNLALCAGSSITLSLTVGQLGSFINPVSLSATDLPAGVTASFAPGTVAAGTTTELTLTAGPNVAAGTYDLLVSGASGSQRQEQRVRLVVDATLTQAPQPTSPDAAFRTTRRPRFGWAALAGAAAYDVQVAADADFSNIVASQVNSPDLTFTPATELLAGARYFWRVRGRSACGTGPYSSPVSFQTSPAVCQSMEATRVPVITPAGPNAEATSIITVASTERVAAIRVLNVNLTAPAIGDLTITLTSPSGQEAVLLAQPCPGPANLSLSFDEQAPSFICPPAASATIRPAFPLANLLNDPATGDWTLTIRNQNAGQATLTGWTLELCTIPTVLGTPAPSAPLAGVEVFPNPSSGVFQVNLANQQPGPVTLVVMDALGRVVRSENLAKSSSPFQYALDLRSASRGVYYLRLTTAQGTSIKRLLKE